MFMFMFKNKIQSYFSRSMHFSHIADMENNIKAYIVHELGKMKPSKEISKENK